MKRNQVNFMSSMVLAATLLLSACGETEDVNTDTTNDTAVDTAGTDTANDLDEMNFDPSIEYKVPTPADLFMALDNSGASANFDHLNDPANVGNYDDKKTKALNLGVYIADLGYATNFDYGPDIVKYLKAVDDLMKELNISGAMDEDLRDRLNAHIASGQKDSLSLLTSEPFYKAYDYLERNERGATLRMVVAGGWVEGLYLLTHMVDDYDESDPIVQEVANQALSVEAVMGFMYEKSDDADVEETMSDLAEIEMIFMGLDYKEEEGATTTSEDGTVMLSGGDRPVINEEQFNELKSKVAELRNSITG